jgi:ABC-2 type transport system permease protein
VLAITGEYATGMIGASLMAVPHRVAMLAAKSLVVAALVLVVGELVAFPSFLVGAAILHARAPVALGDPGLLRAVAGSGLYLAVLGLFALAIGGLVRHTAAATTGVIGLVLVLAPPAQLLPGSFGKHLHAYLPSEAGRLIGQAHQGPHDLLTPWQRAGPVLRVDRAAARRGGLPAPTPRRLTCPGPGGRASRPWPAPQAQDTADHDDG